MRDGGANMKKAFECDELFRHLDCGAHLINLVVKDSLKHPPVSQLLSKCRHIVGHFKHSNLAVGEFRKIQLEEDLPEHMLLQDMPIRWNASYLMLARLKEQRVAVQNFAYKKDRRDLDLTDREWVTVDELVALLKPMDELTRIFCDDSSAFECDELFRHLDCGAHLINLVVKNSLKHPPVSQLLSKCRHIVGHFKHSNLAVGEFRKIQLEEDLPEHMLLQDMPIRWNASYLMLARLKEQRVAVQNFAYKKDRRDLDLTDREWVTVDELVALLKPMDELTRIFCDDSSVAVQYVFAALAEQTLSNQIFLKNDVEIVQTKMLQGLKTRLRNLIDKKEIAVGQFLDPQLQDLQTECTGRRRRGNFFCCTQSDSNTTKYLTCQTDKPSGGLFQLRRISDMLP
uniref:Transposase n=1 Tax=Globodera rostochiensis TaxID=31243 RepID=A0A914HNS3_GLORO